MSAAWCCSNCEELFCPDCGELFEGDAPRCSKCRRCELCCECEEFEEEEEEEDATTTVFASYGCVGTRSESHSGLAI